MKSPPHPGRLVRSACLEPLELSVSAAARLLGVARPTLSNVLNGRAAVSAEMALRLEKAFGSTAEAWVQLQGAHDLAVARRRVGRLPITRVRPRALKRDPRER
jgi:addiction module HigA family antidote